MFTYTCPMCNDQIQTDVKVTVVAHDCPMNTKERSKRKVNRTLTSYVMETREVRIDWVAELVPSDQDLLMECLADDNLANTYDREVFA